MRIQLFMHPMRIGVRSCGNRGGGLGGIALAYLLGRDGLLGRRQQAQAELNGGLHHRAKAKRVVQLFMSGAASQVDTFDYKPELIKRHGQKFDPGGKVELFQSIPGHGHEEPVDLEAVRQVRQVGQRACCRNLGGCVDDMALHSLDGDASPTSTARRRSCRRPASCCRASRAMGAWISYGLGSLNDNLPTFVVLPDSRGYAPNGPANWGTGFLPAAHQGTMVRPGARTADLRPFSAGEARSSRQRAEADGLGRCSTS